MPRRSLSPLAPALALSLLWRALSLQSQPQREEELERGSDADDADWIAGYRTRARNIGRITVVTVETRAGDPMKLPGRNSGLNDSTEVKNVGAGAKWKYYRTKNGLMLKWINETMKKDPDAMAIMIDGGDMIFGGCNENLLMTKYKKVLKASGGTGDCRGTCEDKMALVMSAETACFPSDMGWHFRETGPWEERRAQVNAQVEHLADDWVLPWSPCRDRKIAPCDPEDKRAYRYPNWGWVMGPVKRLKPLFEFVYNNGAPKQLDQKRAMWWMLTNPDYITLDYSGSLVLSLHNMAYGRHDSEAPIEIKQDKRGRPYIRSKITNEPLCFAHGNGDGEGFINRMAIHMNNLTGAV